MSLLRPKKWEIAVGVPLVALLLVYLMFFGRWRIPQDGMFPTFPAGAHILARKLAYGRVEAVRRGDVVIYTEIRDGDRYDFIWRVVGLPGERVAIQADSVIVNGRELPRRSLRQQSGFAIFEETADGRSYEIALPTAPDGKSDHAEIQVPTRHLFVLGDNRHNAADSRSRGTVPFEAIVAKAIW
jgi:signal peptidase I